MFVTIARCGKAVKKIRTGARFVSAGSSWLSCGLGSRCLPCERSRHWLEQPIPSRAGPLIQEVALEFRTIEPEWPAVEICWISTRKTGWTVCGAPLVGDRTFKYPIQTGSGLRTTPLCRGARISPFRHRSGRVTFFRRPYTTLCANLLRREC